MNRTRQLRLLEIGLKKCSCGRIIWDFELAHFNMPSCLGGDDPHLVKTLEDLRVLAITEIDNYLGGENFCDAPDIQSAKQLRQVRNYVSTLDHAIAGGCQ